ncbi:MAG: T9SS type A sorting domain-containing protein [Saprospiraceae bacterium]
MPHSTIRIIYLWTCLLGGFYPSLLKSETTLPPVLNNPSGCNLGLPIKDFSCDASHFFQINVTNAPGNALGQDVYLKEVRLIIAHEWDADLDIKLISPNDVGVELSTDNGSGQDFYGNPNDCSQAAVFISGNSPDACNTPSITEGHAPFIGKFLPEQSFMPIHDGTNPNDFWIIQICDDGKEHEGTLEYVELVFEAMACLNPTEVEVVSVDSTTVLLDWMPGSNCDSTYLEFGPIGFLPGSGSQAGAPNISSVVLDSCPPLRLHNLDPSTSYQLYIRDKCSTGFSINSCPVSFSTTCSPPTISLKEDFNAQINCVAQCGVPCPISGVWTNSLIDDFDWIISDKNNITDVGTGPDDDNPGGGKYIYIESSSAFCRGGKEGVLVSNCLFVKAGTDSCDMSFDYLLNGVHVNALLLEYKEMGSPEWKLLELLEGDLGAKWKTKFVDLDLLNGKTAQFRFRALGGSGSKGDIALDNIHFYGTEDLGPGQFVYYQDFDEDGYGGQDIFFASCEMDNNLPGFVLNNTDCDDDNYFMNPGMNEFPCDGVDQNCNGMADEDFFASPIVRDTTICSGASTPFKATSIYGGQIIWFSDPVAMDTVFIGNEFTPVNFPTNFGSSPITLTYYAQEFLNPICFSTTRSQVNITILPQPDINTTDSPIICEGATFDLSTVDVIDNNGANGIITYHNTPTPGPGDTISPIVTPLPGQTFYVASTPVGGCTDIVAVPFTLKESPVAEIVGENLVCKNTTQSLVALNTGNVSGNLTYNWNTGDTTKTIDISSNPLLGGSNTYIVEIESSNGCSDKDTMTVTTTSNITTVQRIVGNVTACEGSDGTISLTPLDGTPPYHFRWGNGMSETGNSLFLDNLSQGAYSFTITDSSPQQCEFIIPLMTVDGPGAVVASYEVKHVSCNGAGDGRITLNINGNNPVISWQNGSDNDTIDHLSAGMYEVTITDGDCENILAFEVKQPDKITVNPFVSQPKCFGENDGSIFLNTFGGTPPYQFDWENGLTTQGINNLQAGTYPVTISDSKDCRQEIPNLLLRQPDEIFFDTTALFPPTCFGFNDGKISIKPKGGTSPFDVDWDNGAMGTTINSLTGGTYVVSIEDANGCLFSQPLELSQPPLLEMSIDETKAPTCKGLTDGAIEITAFGGTAGYSFLWNNNQTEEDLIDLPEGNYLLTITDGNNCSLTSDTIRLVGPELMSVTAVIKNPPCEGQSTGSIEVCLDTINGQSFSYDWSTDESGCTIINQPPGTYTVTVTDDLTGCQIDTTFSISTQQVLSLNIVTDNPACFNSADGQIYLNATGGTAPLTCSWDDVPDLGCVRTNLLHGNYAATVTDANGCTIASNLLTLENPNPIELELEGIDVPACYGDSTGSIEVVATGGTGLLHYNWSSGDTASIISGLGSGIFTLSVKDENDCAVNQQYEVIWPLPMEVEEKRFISGCNTLDSVSLIVSGGVGGFGYSWNHGNSTNTLANVPVGDYTVTITDQAGCTLEVSSIKIPEIVQPMYLQQMNSRDSICLGATDGELNIFIEGGQSPYQYIWDHGIAGNTSAQTLILNNLEPGIYQVTLTDSDGCVSVSPSYFIIEGSEVVATVSDLSQVNCKDEANGSIDINIIGGFPVYETIWQNSIGDTLSQSAVVFGLPAGMYTAHITDSQQCPETISVTITEPDLPLGIIEEVISPVVCFGDENGSIDISPTGGTKPYFFTWSNLATTEDLTNIPVGTYDLLVTDGNDCPFRDTFIIEGPDQPLGLNFYEILSPACYEDENGSINVEIVGGTPPYTYDWGVSNDEDLLNAGAGTYQLTVYDSTDKCVYDTLFEIAEPPLLAVDTSSTPDINGDSIGSATVVASGGTPPYYVEWETGDTTSTIENLVAGWYEFTITDANFCSINGGVWVPGLTPVINNEQIVQYLLAPNPTRSNIRIEFSLANPLEIELNLYNSIGEIIFKKEVGQSLTGNISLDLNNYPSGIYYVALKNEGQFLVSSKVLKL